MCPCLTSTFEKSYGCTVPDMSESKEMTEQIDWRAKQTPQAVCSRVQCFRNPPNSDIDYRIFNVRTWLFLCTRIHTGVGHTNKSAEHFDLEKQFLVLRMGFDPLVFGSWIDALPMKPPRHPTWPTLAKGETKLLGADCGIHVPQTHPHSRSLPAFRSSLKNWTSNPH